MSVKAKDQIGGDLCKSHAARCDKDYFRACPSKLSKRELEDLYYSLLENNLELKRAVNSQNEKIRNLSTKVQRMTAQNKTSLTRDPKECCAAAKVAISEQREAIADLKKANECMAERIRRLNMRLCSAKQFLKRSPNQCASKCFNCISRASTSVKNLSTSALHDNSDNLRSVALSAQSVIKKSSTTRTVETNTPEYNVDSDKVTTDKICDENKCRTTMEEFKQKILDLQEELSLTHTEYAGRMSQLEEQVSALRAARAHSLRNDDAQLATRLRDAGAAAELESQLTLERGKVAELEMRLKAADMSREVAGTIERHLSNVSQMEEKRRASHNDSERCNICMSPRLTVTDVTPNKLPAASKRLSQLTVPEDKFCQSEDSGYADNRDSDKDGSMHSMNRELIQRVAYLQAQLDALKSTVDNTDQSPTSVRSKSLDFHSYDVIIKDGDVPLVKNVKDYNCVIIDPTKKVIVEIEHVNNDTKENEFHHGQNSPNGDTKLTQDDQQPTSSKHRASILSKQQTKFASQTNQRRTSKEGNELEPTRSQTSKKESEFDQVSKRSSIDSKLNPYSSNKHIIDIRVDNDQKTNNYYTDDVRMEEGDDMLSSHYTVYKSDTQDNVSNTKDAVVKDSLLDKVLCECPKCEVPGNSDVPDQQILDEMGNDSVVCQKVEESSKNQEMRVKRESQQMMDTELPQRISQKSMSPRPTQDTASTDDKASKIPVKTKYDRHNSLQIPGPLPIDSRDSGASKISKTNAKNGTLKGQRGRRKYRGISIEGICGNGPTTPIRKDNIDAEQNGRFKNVANEKTVDNEVAIANNKRGDVSGNHKEETEKKISFEPDVAEEDVDKATCSRNVTKFKGVTTTGPQTVAGQEQPIRPKASGPTCLGGNPGTDRPSAPSAGNTYNVPDPEVFKSRASTPENTENEISGMTDLPTERDGTTPRDLLSPGEHKTTTSYTDSYTPGQEQFLSEGEVPNGTAYSKRKGSMSMGEYPGDKRPDDIGPYNQEASAQRMEAALQAISQELARCRSLLHSQRPREPRPPSRDVASAAALASRESIALRKAEGKRRLSGGNAPKCNFILHVGTIVLSDEAVMSSRDKPLILSWKFYDQNVTMTRMTAERVVQFDYSTEYEVKITEGFLEYLMREEMPITICEIDKEEPFARCTLPLREALLNANRRADLSLALMADSPAATDELGVLDLWCMLRAEPKHLALCTADNREVSVNYGVLTKNMLNPQHEKLLQIMDDDLSDTCRMSQDLDMHRNRQYLNMNVTSTDSPGRDFYVPQCMSTNLLGVHSSPRHRSKFSGPSISSDLGMASFDKRHSCAIQSPSRLPPPMSTTNKDMSFPSIEGFEKKDKNRRNTTLSCVTNIIDSSASDDNRKNGNWRDKTTQNTWKDDEAPKDNISSFTDYLTSHKKYQDISVQSDGAFGKKVTIDPNSKGRLLNEKIDKAASTATDDQIPGQTLSITILWLALNEECDAMLDPTVRRLYVAYSFLGRVGAELETPISLPKPKHYMDKCYFNFKKTFHLTEFDMPILDHMAKCRSQSRTVHNSKDCIVFTVVSEPPEDPLGLDNCEDIGYAFLYLGDLLAYSSGDTFTEVVPVRAARAGGGVCGVLAVRLDGLATLRTRPCRLNQ